MKDETEHLKSELYKQEKELQKYQQGFNILMEYFDSISDEEKPKVNKKLKKIGL